MRTRWLLLGILLTGYAAIATAQTTDPNPGHSPDVFLDNHRPLNSKKGKAPTTRNVSGKVTDENGQPLNGALVTLTDTKANAKLTLSLKRRAAMILRISASISIMYFRHAIKTSRVNHAG